MLLKQIQKSFNLQNNTITILEEFFNLFVKENETLNLSKHLSFNDFFIKGVYDSLLISKVIALEEQTILDIGCGGGFPSLILAICFPNTQIYAMDSIAKKITAIDKFKTDLNLSNISTINARAKEANHNSLWQGKFDIITARAVANAASLIKESRLMLKEKALMCFYKAPSSTKEEHFLTKREALKFKLHLSYSKEFHLPNKKGIRSFTLVSKTNLLANPELSESPR